MTVLWYIVLFEFQHMSSFLCILVLKVLWWYNLYCVSADVKPCSINQSMMIKYDTMNLLLLEVVLRGIDNW